MLWKQCKDFGVIQIDKNNNTIRLFWNQFSFQLAGSPNFLIINNCIWQGENLIINGSDFQGNNYVYIMNGFNSYQRIV